MAILHHVVVIQVYQHNGHSFLKKLSNVDERCFTIHKRRPWGSATDVFELLLMALDFQKDDECPPVRESHLAIKDPVTLGGYHLQTMYT